MNNWCYAGDIPTRSWLCCLSVPRSLSLLRDGRDYHLLQSPI
jgi:sucrose-6-phosphate hydrolase SacC (GH32 family)